MNMQISLFKIVQNFDEIKSLFLDLTWQFEKNVIRWQKNLRTFTSRYPAYVNMQMILWSRYLHIGT